MESHISTTIPNVADLNAAVLRHFGVVDYLVFIFMLLVCAVIGFYFGFIERRQKKHGKTEDVDAGEFSETENYLVAGREMKVLPIALSLVASYMSGITLLGTATEVYVYGTQYAFFIVTTVFSGIIAWYVYLPVFCNLQITSTYEYFEMRFGRSIRYFASVLFVIGMLLYLPVCMYVPALAFNQVTGMHIHVITWIVCLICTFYTCVGGLKAVIWSDVVQSFVMYGAIITVCIKGTIDLGGFDVVFQRNLEGGRLNMPELTWDPTARLSMLSVMIGGIFHKIQSSDVNQVTIQRFMSLPDVNKVKQTLIYYTILLIFIMVLCSYMGLLAFANYHDCDPISTKLAKTPDQMPSLLIMRILGEIPGMPGLFIAGVFSAALSTLSTGLNSLSCVISQDFINPVLRRPLTDRQTAILLRLIVIVFGLGCIFMVYVVEKLGMVLQLATMMTAVSMGPLLGIYTMGVTLPKINEKSALTGGILSFLGMIWICVNAQILQMKGQTAHTKLPVYVHGCTYSYDNSTLTRTTTHVNTEVPWSIYNLSFLWYTAFGATMTILFALSATLAFGSNKVDDVDEKLLSPVLRAYFNRRKYKNVKLEILSKTPETMQ